MRWTRLRRLGPWWGVAIGCVAGVALAAVGLVRSGGYLVAVSLAMGAIARALLPREGAGGLAVRRRWVDIATWSWLAVAVFVAFTLVAL